MRAVWFNPHLTLRGLWLAITDAQVRRFRLSVIRKPDRRYHPVRHHHAVQTEALGQGFIVRTVRAALNAALPEPLAQVRVRERAQQATLRAALAKMARSAP